MNWKGKLCMHIRWEGVPSLYPSIIKIDFYVRYKTKMCVLVKWEHNTIENFQSLIFLQKFMAFYCSNYRIAQYWSEESGSDAIII